MEFTRSSGILLHPTSLPGPHGIGDLGPQAFRWIDFLADAGCSLWQVLPLGPTGYGDSPYQSFSAFAGNPLLISPDWLVEADLLMGEDLSDAPVWPIDRVMFGDLIPWKMRLLGRAYERWKAGRAPHLHSDLERFREEEWSWLGDYALFMALKEKHQGSAWCDWTPVVRGRDPAVIEAARRELSDEIARHVFLQYVFFRQWDAVRDHAMRRQIKIIGDVPIFVAYDSADVWANPELFHLSEQGEPTVVAGVPPDYFSTTGQLWGNPLYRWDVHARDGYSWWLRRLGSVLRRVDIFRLDHFRGFASYWEIPADAETAETGRWVPGPGAAFFEAVQAAMGQLPIIAEDLGEITADVLALRDRFKLPGMKILVFAFTGGPDNLFLPHHYGPHCVVYTGTHDNDTVEGWYQRVENVRDRDFFHRYTDGESTGVSWQLVRMAWSSVASFSLAPMQDILGLDNAARMNYPGRPGGNWSWRMGPSALSDVLKQRLQLLNEVFSRNARIES